MMKQGFLALKSGDWEEKNQFQEVKVSEWAFDRIKGSVREGGKG